jgi:F-type H+-transporting ATPase subunit a
MSPDTVLSSLSFGLSLGLPLAEADPTEHIRPHPIHFGGLSISNTIVMLGLSGILMLLVFPLAARRKDRIPRGLRNFVESVLVFIRESVARPSLHEATDRYVPILWTVFFLILFANLLGALPIGALYLAITGHKTHFGGTATGDFSVTVGLAVCAFFAIHIAGFREHGFLHYCKSFAPHVPWPLLLLLVPLEVFAAFVKPFALAIRLFANMIAGHIVLAILLGFAGMLADAINGVSVSVTVASVAGAVFISLLELFVAFLQAYVFTFLTTLFLGMAVHPEH